MRVAVLAFALSLIVAVSSVSLTHDKVTVARSILESYMNQPEKELFKVYHYIFEKQYSLNTQEAIRRYKLFKNAVAFIKEHNSKNLSWTVELNEFADMTNEEYLQYSNLSAPSSNDVEQIKPSINENYLGEIFRGRKLGFFDDMADRVDSLNDDDDQPLPKEDNDDLNDVDHGKWMPEVKNQRSCGSCWAFTAAAAIEAAWNIAKNTGSSTIMEPVYTKPTSTQQLVDCDPYSHGCNGGWMTYAFRYLSNYKKTLAFEENYPYTAKDGECKDTEVTSGINVTGHEGCAPGWWGYPSCTLQSFHDLLEKSPVGVAIDTNHEGFRYYRKGIIDMHAYENSDSPYNCGRLTHAITVYAMKKQNIPGLNSRFYFTVRNSWGTYWGEKGDFSIYYTSKYNSTCWITKIAARPIVSLE